MTRYIYLSNFYATKEQKIDLFYNDKVSRNTKICTLEECFELVSGSDEFSYNEFVLSSGTSTTFNLFFDIDCKINEIENINDINYQLEMFIIDIKSGLKEYIKDKDNLDLYFEDIGITKNSDSSKHSFHIFFKNIIISFGDIIKLKEAGFFKNIKKNTHSQLTQFLDEQVYNLDLKLRLIGAIKDMANKEKDYNKHYNFKPDILTLKTLPYFTFSFPVENINVTTLFFKKKTHESIINFDFKIDEYKNYYFSEYFSISNIKIKLRETLRFTSPSLEALWEYDKIVPGSFHEFSVNYCSMCKRAHKNKFTIKFDKSNISITKDGNSLSCLKLRSISQFLYYPKVTITNILTYLYDVGYVKCLKNKDVIFWYNNRWNNVYTSHLLIYYIKMLDFLRSTDNEVIDKETKDMFNILITVIGDRAIDENSDPYILRFNNGFYFLKENKFEPYSENFKHIVKTNIINIDFKTKEELINDEDYLTSKKELTKILNEIVFSNDDEDNSKAFKASISSILYNDSVPVITFLIGDTSSGKSTIKMLIETLFKESFLNIGMDAYTNIKSQNQPNPWLGNIGNKLVTFASESSESASFKTVNFKQLTERFITARQLNSNKCQQRNTATQFIDTNHMPEFDYPNDPALSKRYAIILFNSYFYDKRMKNAELRAGHRTKLFIRDDSLYKKVKSEIYNLPLIHLMIEWFIDIHLDGLKMETYEIMDINENENIFSSFLKKHTMILTNGNVDILFKNEVKSYYKTVKFGKFNYIVSNNSLYFLGRLSDLFKIHCEENDLNYEELNYELSVYIKDRLFQNNLGFIKRILIDDLKSI